MSKGQLLLFAFVCATFVWHQARSSPARAMAYNTFNRDAKIPRTIRAPFRNREMMTARGFGKRSQVVKYKEGECGNKNAGEESLANLGNSSDLLLTFSCTAVESPWMLTKNDLTDGDSLDFDPMEQMVSESSMESFPIDWLVASPALTRAMLSRFLDTNRDGILSAQELLAAGGGAHSPAAALSSSERF